jgi:hypothetical protein
MWFQVELPQSASVTEIQFESPAQGGRGGRGGAAGRGAGAQRGRGAGVGAPAEATPAAPVEPPAIGYPRAYTVAVSADGSSWRQVAIGQGTGTLTDVMFAPATAKFIRISQTAAPDNAPAWTIRNFRVFAPGRPAR